MNIPGWGTPDYINGDDLLARYEELEEDITNGTPEELIGLATLITYLAACCEDGTENTTLIHEDRFAQHAMDTAYNLVVVDRDQMTRWPFTAMDWDKAADQLAADYGTVIINGATYLYR